MFIENQSGLEVSVSGDDSLYLGRNTCNELENLGIVAVKYDVTIRKAIEWFCLNFIIWESGE